MRNLTDRQRETLEHIRAYMRRHGFPPSRKELSECLGLTHPSSVDVHLTALQVKGWIEIRRDTKRGMRLVGDADPTVPLVDLVEPIGEIAAGEPIVAESRIVDRIPSTVAERFSPTPDYFLTVRGDSMDRTGLRDGDVVAILATPEAKNGDVVVARFGDEVTLKRFVRLDTRHVSSTPTATTRSTNRFGSTSPSTSCTSTGSRSGRSSGGWEAHANKLEQGVSNPR